MCLELLVGLELTVSGSHVWSTAPEANQVSKETVLSVVCLVDTQHVWIWFHNTQSWGYSGFPPLFFRNTYGCTRDSWRLLLPPSSRDNNIAFDLQSVLLYCNLTFHSSVFSLIVKSLLNMLWCVIKLTERSCQTVPVFMFIEFAWHKGFSVNAQKLLGCPHPRHTDSSCFATKQGLVCMCMQSVSSCTYVLYVCV